MEQSNSVTSVLDFNGYITERTKNFTGRKWIFEEINKWIAASDGERFFIITGEPGSGKSSLAARLCQFSQGTVLPPANLNNLATGFLSAFHFCRSQASLWLDPLSFTHSIAAQLGKSCSPYRQALIDISNQRSSIEGYATVAGEVQTGAVVAGVYIKNIENLIFSAPDAREAFNRFILEPLLRIYRQGCNDSIIILVEGLDESLIAREKDAISIGGLLFNLEELPRQVRFIVTTGPITEILRSLQRSRSLCYSLSSGPHLALSLTDIKLHILQMLKANPLLTTLLAPDMSAENFSTVVEKKSDGNFLYLYHLLHMLESQEEQITYEMIDRLPTGLHGIYLEFLERLINRNQQVWEERYAPTMGALAVAQEGLNEAQLASIMGALAVAQEGLNEAQLASFVEREQPKLRGILQELRQLLDADDSVGPRLRIYTIYHKSFIDFLLDTDSSDEFWCEPKTQHKQLADWCERGNRTTIWHDVEKKNPAEQGRREYARKYYITHLFKAEEWQQLFLILDSAEYGRAKIRHGSGALAYAQDLELGQRAVREVTREGLNTTETLALLPNLWRYSLLRSNLGNTDSYPDTAFNVMVALGQQERALKLVPLLTNPFRRTIVLVSISIQIAEERGEREEEAWRVLLRACDVMRENIGRDPGLIQSVLQELEEVRPFALQVPFLDEVAKITLAINNNTLKISTLVAIAAALMKVQGQYRTQGITQTVTQAIAQTVEQTISNADQDTKILREIVETLVKVQLWDSAITIAHSIGDEKQREDARAHIIHGLLANYAWDKAKALAQKVEGHSRFYALATVARARAKAQPELAEELLSEIEGLTNEWDFKDQDYALKVVVDDLAMARLWDRATHAVWSIHDDEQKVEAIRGLARAMTEAGKQEQVTALLTRMTKTVCHEQEKDVVLVKAVETLLDAQLWDDAEMTARIIRDFEQRYSAIVAVASTLATAQPEHAQVLLTEAETSIRSNGTRTWQSDQVLKAIISTLAEMHLWDRARVVAHSGSEEAKLQSHASLQIANALAEIGEWDRAVSAAQESTDYYGQGQTLRAIVNRLIELQVWDKAIFIAHVISDDDQQSEALVAIVQALVAVKEWNKALTVARAISVEMQKATALKVEIDALEMEQIQEYVKNSAWPSNLSDGSDDVNEMDGEDEEEYMDYADDEEDEVDEELMLPSGSLLSQEMALCWDNIRAAAQSLSNERIQSETQADLFEALIKLRLWDRALKIASDFTRAKDRDAALFALSTSLAASGVWGNAAAIARSISESGGKAEALAITAISIVRIDQPRAEAFLSEALASVQTTNDDVEVENEALARLAITLAQKGQWDRAVTIIRTLQHTPQKVETFIALANNIALAEPEHAVSLLSEAATIARTLGGEARAEQLSEVAEAFHKIGQKEQVRVLLAEIMTLTGRDPENFDWSALDRQGIGDTDDGIGTQDKNWGENSDEKVLAEGKKTMRVSRPEQVAEKVFRRMGSEQSFSESDTTLRDVASTLAGKRLWHQAVALTWSIRDPRQKVMALTWIVIVLAQAEQMDRARLLLQEAEAVAYSIEDDDDRGYAGYKGLSDRDFALNELVKAQTIVLDVEGAEAAARSMSKDQHQLKDLAFCQVIRIMAKTKQWDRAIELIQHIGEHKWRVSAWTAVSDAFIAQGEYARALSLIQEKWIHAPTRNGLLQLLPLAMDFIALRPELGWEFYEAFAWADKFLEA